MCRDRYLRFCGAFIALVWLALTAAQAQTTTYTLGTTSLLVGPFAGSNSVVLAVTPATASWTAAPNATWLHLSATNLSGTGSTNVVFGYDSNPSATRSGTLSIAGQTLTVTQAGSTYVTAGTVTTLVSTGGQPSGVAVDVTGNVYIADSGDSAIKEWTVTNKALTSLVSTGLNAPSGVAVDGAGNVYFTDTGNNAIKEWSAVNSNVTTLVSGLDSPYGIAVDRETNVYFADIDGVVFEWLAAGGGVTNLIVGLKHPHGVAVDCANNLYVASTYESQIQEWTPGTGNLVNVAGSPNPYGVAVDGSGNVYIADTYGPAINMLLVATGAEITLATGPGITSGVAVDRAGNVYTADPNNSAIEELPHVFVDRTAKSEGLAAGNDSLPVVLPATASLQAPFAPTSDQSWLTITSITNGVISFAFTATASSRTGYINVLGQLIPVMQRASSQALGTTAVAEGPGAGADSVALAVYPYSNAWTATANSTWLHLIPANQGGATSTNVIFSFDANAGATRSGTLTIAGQTLTVTQAGSTYVAVESATTLVSGLAGPFGVAVDGAGNVYAANYFKDTITKWTAANNTVTTLVSSGLNNPEAVAVGSGGNVYIADNSDNAIKELANGNLSTLVFLGSYTYPTSVAVDGAANVYFADGAIDEWIAATGSVATLVPGGSYVAVDTAGNNVYFTSGTSIQDWTAANNAVTTLVSSGLSGPSGVAVDGAGNLYVADVNSYVEAYTIKKWTLASNSVTTLYTTGLGQPAGPAVDRLGNVYFADSYRGLVIELPRAFVDPTPKVESLTAVSDSLPVVLPTAENLNAPFNPTSDQSWLTITGTSGGVVSFSFSTNTGVIRTAHISFLGQTIPVTQNGPTFSLGTSALLVGPAAGSNSVVVSVFPNFGVWTAATNVSWLHLTPSMQSGTGSTNLIFSCDANPGPTRSGTITISGQTLNVTQAGSTYVAAGPVTPLVFSGLAMPHGVAVDGVGNVYIANTGSNTIEEWTLTNNTVTTLVSGLNGPSGAAVDGAGNVYFADTGNNAIKEWSAVNSNVTTLILGLNGPSGVAVDGAGNVYFTDTGINAIKEWVAASGNVIILVPGLNGPSGVAVDAADNVYIADSGNNAIKEWVAANSNLTTLVSGLNAPSGVAVDRAGNLYLASTFSNSITKWTAASNTLTALGSGFSSPAGVAVDGTGNVYIADTGNNAIKEVPYAFVNQAPKSENANAGNDLLVVLPATENLLAPFTPTRDEPWLTITGITNGVVNFSFTANFGSSRTGHLTLLGQPVSITQGGLSYSVGATTLLVGPTAGSNSVVLAVMPATATWTAAPNATWLHLSAANLSGTSSTNVVFGYDSNPGATRSGTLTIAGQTLAVTQAGSTYVTAGTVTTLVSTGLITPSGVAVDATGNVYIADTVHGAIKEWMPANNTVTTLVSTGLELPVGVRLDGSDNVYFSDSGLNTIKEWTPANSNVTTLVASGLLEPEAVAVGVTGNVYIADTSHAAIKEWMAVNNSVTTLISSGLNEPDGVAVDLAGNIYVADYGHNAIKELAAANTNVISLVSSGLNRPSAVVVDGSGNVYIADAGDNTIKEWTVASNILSTLAASGLSQPEDVAVDVTGNVYIADSGHNAIKELPHAFVDPTPRLESMSAGSDALPAVMPATQNLPPPFAPVSSQSWLTIDSVTNGIVSFSFTANTGPARTANINLLGQTIPIIQGVIGTPPTLTGLQMQANGVFQFTFTNTPRAAFTVVSTTNLSLPLSNWATVGNPVESPPGMYQFTSQPTTNNMQIFYGVLSP
ncbi:MAG TPA: BACON domain-containing carbohydrate-binding protein [Candidatus Saccharimonadales bacterium]|nr:BACON domain-containing carbohydrate-binding protein [Candidatus Saccharimonadales bacterium]